MYGISGISYRRLGIAANHFPTVESIAGATSHCTDVVDFNLWELERQHCRNYHLN